MSRNRIHSSDIKLLDAHPDIIIKDEKLLSSDYSLSVGKSFFLLI